MATQIVKSKAFHHNNLVLRAIYDTDFDIYSIEIHRLNDDTVSNLWGCFMSKADVLKKFDTISL